MADPIRAISLHQPWATLIAQGAKKIETRSWRTPRLGWVAIHAAKVMPPYALALTHDAVFQRAITDAVYEAILNPPRGAVVAVAQLVECRFTGTHDEPTPQWVRDLSPQELAFGDFSPGRYGWRFEDVRALPEPVPCRGTQGIWRLTAEVWESIAQQLVGVR